MPDQLTTKVLLANVAPMFKEGIRSMLTRRPNVQVDVDSGSVDYIIHRVLSLRPHFVIVSLLFDSATGGDTIAKIRHLCPETRVLALVLAKDDMSALRAAAEHLGAHGALSPEWDGDRIWQLVQELSVVRAASAYKLRLQQLPIGDATGYQNYCEEVLPFLFEPYFTGFQSQVRQGTGEKPDMVCKNGDGHPLCTIILQDHNARYIAFEFKNEDTPAADHLRQLSSYLRPYTGNFGILMVRQAPKSAEALRDRLTHYLAENKQMLLPLYDTDVEAMLDMRAELARPMDYLEKRYDYFRTRL